ncbi:SRSF protein kinase 1-like [Drosophila innubila]|uniref:SRSF protein kinase 1-like n=1 Tax=Drosophila innubila TaxID=198719 RepID=UPI00148D02D0|nr:SRSF protein kinase 1-like [Drosophila innubila]
MFCLFTDRYFVLKNLENDIYWLCWDLQEKREVTIKVIEKPHSSETNLVPNDCFQNSRTNLNESLVIQQENRNVPVIGLENVNRSERTLVIDKSIQNFKTNLGELTLKRCYVLASENNGQMVKEKEKLSWDLEVKRSVLNKSPKEHKRDDCNSTDPRNDKLMDQQEVSIVNVNAIEKPNESEMHSRLSECLRNFNTNLGELLQERYFVLNLLCNGLMAKVLLCWDLQVKRDVVIKIPKEQEDDVDMVANEVQMLRAAHNCHPTDPRRERIIQIFEDFNLRFSDGTVSCAVLEAMDGTVLDLIEDSAHHSLPLAIVKNISRQLLEGLDYLHGCKIIHTDIKPENVLYLNGKDSIDNVRIKIADLGNACYEHRHISWEIQTPPYRSLEAILDAGYDTSADIWSAACVIYELATGDYLFEVKHENYVIRDMLHLAAIIEHLGPLPHHIILRGRKSSSMFDEFGQLRNLNNIYSNNILNMLLNRYSWSLDDAQPFASFLEYMLELDPDNRPKAAECLQHPWLN